MDFYVLSSADDAARAGFACRLAEKVYLLDQRVHLRADSPSRAAEIDELLWTFRQGSFVPHEILRDGVEPASPVTIGAGAATPPGAELLINLAADAPPLPGAVPRIAEIVDASDAGRRAGRERFRQYRSAGCEPVTHNVDASP